jgi:hypothetical protein
MLKYFVFFVTFLLISCKSQREELVDSVTERYSNQVINYFYELCFNEKWEENGYLRKWNKNLCYSLEGDTSISNERILLEVAAEINAIGLPITISESKSRQEANVTIIFDSLEKLNLERPKNGVTQTFNTGNEIDSVVIRIATDVSFGTRRSTIIHELLHSLGFASHVISDAKSALFAIVDSTQRIGMKEKQALLMLYTCAWPTEYNEGNFEKDFSSNLYHIQAKSKFRKYIHSNQIDSSIVGEIHEHGLIRPEIRKQGVIQPSNYRIVKHASSLKITCKNAPSTGVMDTLQMFIDEINLASSYFQLDFLARPHATPKYGITINFKKIDNKPNDFLAVGYSNFIYDADGHATLSVITSTTITIQYNKNSVRLQKFLGNVIYQAISLKDYYHFIDAFEPSHPTKLKPKYKEILKLYYAPELPYNFSKQEFDSLKRGDSAET